jgi:hypothetical protein
VKKRINVTANDIRRGRGGDCTSCPIAIATQRHFRGRAVVVSTFAVSAGRCSASLPDEAVDFIQKLDSDKDVEPFFFIADFR